MSHASIIAGKSTIACHTSAMAPIDQLIRKMTTYYDLSVVDIFKWNGAVGSGSWPLEKNKRQTENHFLGYWYTAAAATGNAAMCRCGMLYARRRKRLLKVLLSRDEEQEMEEERRYTAVNRHSTVSKPLFYALFCVHFRSFCDADWQARYVCVI